MVKAEILAGTSRLAKLIFHVTSAFTEFERTMIRKRVKAGLREARPTEAVRRKDDRGAADATPLAEPRMRGIRRERAQAETTPGGGTFGK